MSRQSELSIATFWFYCAGAIFALLAVTVFQDVNAQNSYIRAGVITATFVTAVLAIVLGRRYTVTMAAFFMTLTCIVLIYFPTNLPSEYARSLQGVNIGMLFIAVLIYFVWFIPMWYARIVCGTWLLLYVIVMVVKFGDPVYPFLVTYTVTMVVLGELLYRFKTNLEAASLTDPLTGVWNKRGFDHLLDKAVKTAKRNQQPLSVLFIDIDNFKQINDELGHHEGDRILREFAREMEEATRSTDTLARLGGDEFALIAPLATRTIATEIGSRLRSKVTAVAWSYGVADLRDGDGVSDLLARADAAMFEEKSRRRA